MSTRLQQIQLILSSTFIEQLAGSLLASAAQIVHEAANAPDHTNRLAYARSIIGNPIAAAQFMAPGVLLNSTIAGEAGNPNGDSGTPIPDSDLDFVVASIFDIYADQYASQMNLGSSLGFGG
jgi:hypothetical protein